MTRIIDLTELTCILRNVIDDIHKSKKFKKLFFLFLNKKSIDAFKCFIQFINEFIVKNLKHLKSCVNTNIKICFNFTDSRGRVLYNPCLSIGIKGLIIAKLDSEDICKLFDAGIITKRNKIEKLLISNLLKGRRGWDEKVSYGVLYGQVGTEINSECSCDNINNVQECHAYDKTENVFLGLGTSGYTVSTNDGSCDCNDYGYDCFSSKINGQNITCGCTINGIFGQICLHKDSDGYCTQVPCTR